MAPLAHYGLSRVGLKDLGWRVRQKARYAQGIAHVSASLVALTALAILGWLWRRTP